MIRTPLAAALLTVTINAVAVAQTAAPPAYKAVFEPVSYSEDLELTSVFFVNDESGWVSGAAGSILHTADGGKTWTPQMGGDPQSPEATIDDLYFLDARTGWAVGANENTVQRKLLATRDGESWRQVGTMGTPHGSYLDYVFTSPMRGLFTEGATGNSGAIHQTLDGGRTWKPVLPQCSTKVRIAGLNKDLACRLTDLFFLTPTSGWAAGAGSDGTVVVFRTQDGGTTWNAIFAQPGLGHPHENHFRQKIFFTDESNGYLLVPRAAKLLTTTDGGRSWETVPVPAGHMSIRFADPEVGWMYGDRKLLFTANGGKSWMSREVRFPADVNDFSMPSRERAYVVGDSGMVFRYRVVEAAHEDGEALPAPLMPRAAESLEPELAKLRQDAEVLRVMFRAAAGTPDESGDPTAAASIDDTETESGASGSSDSDFGGSFEQSAAAAPGEFIDSCCETEFGELQSDMGAYLQEMPAVAGRYRNLNLVLAGLRMVSTLLGQANEMRAAFHSLKQAPDMNSATAALQELLANVDSGLQTVAAGFDSPPVFSDFGAEDGSAATGFAQDFSGQAMDAAASDGTGATAEEQDDAADTSAASASDKIKEKLKGKLKEKLKLPF